MFTTNAKILGHGVNVDGLMGAGIAKTFAEKYERNLKRYKQACKDKHLNPGGSVIVNESGTLILNLASQSRPGRFARYDWLFSSLHGAVEKLMTQEKEVLDLFGSTIAIPEIGCGIGGLEWNKAVYTILTVEKIFPKFEFEVWHYAPTS